MSSILQLPSTFLCPKCGNSTLIFRSFYKRFECSHVEGSTPCGYTEPQDSSAAILRVIEYTLAQAEFREENVQVATELSKIHDSVKQLLSDVDSWNREDGKN